MSKKGFEMSFAWIFAIAVGAIIILLAILFSSKFIQTSYEGINTKAAKEFSNLFDPLQTSVSEKLITSLSLNLRSKVYIECNTYGNFGETKARFAEKSTLGGKWTEPGGDITILNQYIFAENPVEGSNFYFFTAPLNMPFKIADLMIFYSDSYCFVNPPEFIEQDINALGQKNNTNIEIKQTTRQCSESIRVCFSGTGCDINVNCEDASCLRGYITKKDSRKESYFVGNLIYGAIFSNQEIYSCNLNRIIKQRLSNLAEIYSEKAQFISIRGCNTNMAEDMNTLYSLSYSFTKQEQVAYIAEYAEKIKQKNSELQCQLF